MDERPDKPPRTKQPWEISALRLTGLLLMLAGAGGFILGAVEWCMARHEGDLEEAKWFLFWGLSWDVVGILIRAVAGIWAALNRIARRQEDSTVHEDTRRALLGIWETLLKK